MLRLRDGACVDESGTAASPAAQLKIGQFRAALICAVATPRIVAQMERFRKIDEKTTMSEDEMETMNKGRWD